jgi:peptidoglycan/LPS O-acetylase OafA/YrhL
LIPVLAKLQAGENLRIAVVGGSVEMGQETPAGTMLWHDHVTTWLKESYSLKSMPSVELFSEQRVAQMTSPTDFIDVETEMSTNSSWLVLSRALGYFDLVFCQFAVNFPVISRSGHWVKAPAVQRHYQEEFFRKLLSAPEPPAVVLVEWMLPERGFYSFSAVKTPDEYLSKNGVGFAYGTWEDFSDTFLAKYYEISMVSSRDALLHSVLMNTSSSVSIGPSFPVEQVYVPPTFVHPSALGHALIGQLVIHSLCHQFSQAKIMKPVESFSSNRNMHLGDAVFVDPTRELIFEELAAQDVLGEQLNHSVGMQPGIIPNVSKPNSSANLSTSNSQFQVAIIPFAAFQCISFWHISPQERGRQSDSSSVLSTFSNERHFLSVQPLRFFGVVHIVLFHEGMMRPGSLQQFIGNGNWWVQFFFALSGFALYVSQKGVLRVLDAPSFLARRIRTSYPGYLLGSVMALITMPSPAQAAVVYGLGGLLPGFLLVDSWAPPYGIQAPNGPGWFLCSLFMYWLCFPSWYGLIRTCSSPKALACFLWLTSFGLPIVALGQDVGLLRGCSFDMDFATFHPLAHWQTFAFGLCLGRLASELDPAALPSALRTLSASLALAVVAASMFLVSANSDAAKTFMGNGPVLLPFFGLLLVSLSFGEDYILRPVLLESRFAAWLGMISSQLYILHWPVRLCLVKVWPNASLPMVFASQLTFAALYQLLEQQLGGRHCCEKEDFDKARCSTKC